MSESASQPVPLIGVAPEPTTSLRELGGYPLLRELRPEQSYLARAPGGRLVVLKMLDSDCLWRGQLHPSIRDRLARVRELAHPGVANLHGVERDGPKTYLVWEYVEGAVLEDWREAQPASYRDWLLVARELVLAVAGLHSQGIVHGAVHGRNVIIDPRGRVRLTHVSPLLYNDPAEDAAGVLALLREATERRGEEGVPLARVIDELSEAGDVPARGERASEERLRGLVSGLSALIESRESMPRNPEDDRVDRRRRRGALLGAAALAVLAGCLYYGVRQYVGSSPAPNKVISVPARP
jgi:hypothetical protein